MKKNWRSILRKINNYNFVDIAKVGKDECVEEKVGFIIGKIPKGKTIKNVMKDSGGCCDDMLLTNNKKIAFCYDGIDNGFYSMAFDNLKKKGYSPKPIHFYKRYKLRFVDIYIERGEVMK